jgi:hypothetical protein
MGSSIKEDVESKLEIHDTAKMEVTSAKDTFEESSILRKTSTRSRMMKSASFSALTNAGDIQDSLEDLHSAINLMANQDPEVRRSKPDQLDSLLPRLPQIMEDPNEVHLSRCYSESDLLR